jgi:hypothetical protein
MMGGGALGEATVFLDVPAQDRFEDALIGVRPPDGYRLKQQQDSSRGVLIAVILPADLMNQVMAKAQAAEGAFSTRGLLREIMDH